MYASIQNEDRLKAMLKDLGRSTLRGIRRCYKCGTLNGTRGLSCKNKACDVVFTEAGRKKKHSVEVCKLHTSSSPQVFSVRVREKGPDFRGFVQLPAVQSNLDESDTSYLSPVPALCFVESCQRLFNTNILKCHERGLSHTTSACQHILSAMRCCSDAVVLRIDYKVLHSLNTTQFMKDTIWQFSTETPTGSIVQRVSKSIMAVKCKVTTKHPLGFLHITFSPQKSKEKDTYYCSCAANKSNMKTVDSSKNCIHYYACVAAFASDIKLAGEFSSYVLREKAAESFTIEIDPNDDDSRLVDILNNAINTGESVVLSKDDDNNFMLPELASDLVGFNHIVDDSNDLDAGLDNQTLSSVTARLNECTSKMRGVNVLKAAKPRKRRVTPQGTVIKKKKILEKKEPTPRYLLFSGEILDPYQVNLPFITWLASVTEMINQTMHFQFDGKPDPITFQIPHAFFECLMERFNDWNLMSNGTERKRLPNSVSAVTRKKNPPLGSFYLYTWHISSMAHAKAIFDTPMMPLKERRSFIQKADSSYEDVDEAALEEGLSKRAGERSIRPVEVNTFLKIGNVSSDQGSPSVLTINWTPNLLPVSNIGELQIIFEFGHSRTY